MAAPSGVPPMRVLEELGINLSPTGEVTETEAVAAEGAYYLEQVTITETSEDECEYEEIPDDNFSIPEGEEDLAKAIHMVDEQATDTHILEQQTILPSRHVMQEAIEDFLCNFLIKMGMTRTLDCFQAEWYELIQKTGSDLRTLGNVPDVYSQVMLLETENKNLKKDLKHFKQAAEKAKEDLLKTQKERDFHRMHHKRILQEKNKLIADLKGLKLHYASYEPTIRVLHEKHHALLKEKMLTSLERDRAVGKISGLQATLKNIDIGHIQVPVIKGSYETASILRELGDKAGHTYEKENSSEGPTQKNLREAREENGYKTKMKSERKDSEFPVDMQPDPNLTACTESLPTAKFDYRLNNIFRLHELPVSCIVMHPFRDYLVSCSEDRLWKMVGLPKGNVILTGSGHSDWLSDCCFHPSGSKLATSSGDSTIKLWDLSKGECILTFAGHNHAIWSCTWHSCGDFVASASLDMTSKIWDVNSERCRYTLYGHTDSVNSIEFFPFSNTLLTASADKTLSVWDARTGHILASCDSRGVIKLWDFRKLIPIVSIDVGPSPGNEVNFDPSGRVLAQASANGIIHLLDLKSGQIHKLVGHESEVHTVIFSHRAENLYSGGSDGTIRLWL
ncbi:sperm-associated antigen 16 protein isoform X2 [Rattus norvegicus]|uniref:sperm-associated antigen 16 protein isoform X2 n=1 Tax=Rattus norvegicus TaxID=10116 RepID=UPI0019174025|nr:sperm-associated antigen 16 protein isoform X3 [Rattus norvegicus]